MSEQLSCTFVAKLNPHEVWRSGPDLIMVCKTPKDTGRVGMNKQAYHTFLAMDVGVGGQRFIGLEGPNNRKITVPVSNICLDWIEDKGYMMLSFEDYEPKPEMLFPAPVAGPSFRGSMTEVRPGSVSEVLSEYLSSGSFDLHVGTLVGKLKEGEQVIITREGVILKKSLFA